jgi:hypothetical protein
LQIGREVSKAFAESQEKGDFSVAEGRANTAVWENRPNFFHGTKQNGTERDGTAQRKTDPIPFLFSYPFFQNGYTLNDHAYMGTYL